MSIDFYIFFFCSIPSFFLHTADCRLYVERTNHHPYISLPAQMLVRSSFLSVQVKTAACRVQRLAVL